MPHLAFYLIYLYLLCHIWHFNLVDKIIYYFQHIVYQCTVTLYIVNQNNAHKKKNNPERVQLTMSQAILYLNGIILKNYLLTGGRYEQKYVSYEIMLD